MKQFCPVCRQDQCGHLLRSISRDEMLSTLKPHAQTPLDLGVARFAADVAGLFHSQPFTKE